MGTWGKSECRCFRSQCGTCRYQVRGPNLRLSELCEWALPQHMPLDLGRHSDAWPFGDEKAKEAGLHKKKNVADQHLYVLREVGSNVVKIGRTNDYNRRSRDAQGWLHRPFNYVLRVDFGGWAETAVHRMFSDERKCLEWFHETPRVSGWIDAVKRFNSCRDHKASPEKVRSWAKNKWGWKMRRSSEWAA